MCHCFFVFTDLCCKNGTGYGFFRLKCLKKAIWKLKIYERKTSSNSKKKFQREGSSNGMDSSSKKKNMDTTTISINNLLMYTDKISAKIISLIFSCIIKNILSNITAQKQTKWKKTNKWLMQIKKRLTNV